MKPYIVTLHETEKPAVKIYGPFDSETDAIAWGDLWQAANDDSPFWNLIEHDGMPIYPTDPTDFSSPSAEPSLD